MKSVFKKSVIAGALAIGLMVSPVTAGSAVAAEDGTVGVVGIAPFFDPTLPDDGSAGVLEGPFPHRDGCISMARRFGSSECIQIGGYWWFVR